MIVRQLAGIATAGPPPKRSDEVDIIGRLNLGASREYLVCCSGTELCKV